MNREWSDFNESAARRDDAHANAQVPWMSPLCITLTEEITYKNELLAFGITTQQSPHCTIYQQIKSHVYDCDIHIFTYADESQKPRRRRRRRRLKLFIPSQNQLFITHQIHEIVSIISHWNIALNILPKAIIVSLFGSKKKTNRKQWNAHSITSGELAIWRFPIIIFTIVFFLEAWKY